MSYLLLWIETLIASLLWVAMLVAFIAHLQRRWLRVILTALAMLVPILATAGFACIMGGLKFGLKLEPNWFIYAVSLWAAVTVGAEAIVIRGRRRAPGILPAASNWPRGPLAAGFLVAIAVAANTSWNMDLAVLARANILALEAQTRFVAQTPAIVSDAQNAAPLYEAAFVLMRGVTPDLKSWPLGTSDSFDPAEPAMKSFLLRQAQAIKMLRRASALPSCRFDQDLETFDLDVLLPELNNERYSADILCLDACNEAANGRAASALSDCMAVKQMSRHFGQRPMLVSGLVAIGMDALADATLQRVLSAATRPGDLANVNFDNTSAMRLTMRRGLEGEECFGLSKILEYAGGAPMLGVATPSSPNIERLSSVVMPWPMRDFMLPTETDSDIDLLNRVENATSQPYFQAKIELDDILDDFGPNHPHKGMFSGLLAPALVASMRTLGIAEAQDVCDQAAIAMTKYRLDHGAFPAHLDDLVPMYLDAVSLDPFDGKPLRLATKDKQWIIYSVGPDGVDNGGVDMDTHGKGDVIFMLK